MVVVVAFKAKLDTLYPIYTIEEMKSEARRARGVFELPVSSYRILYVHTTVRLLFVLRCVVFFSLASCDGCHAQGVQG